MNNLEILKALTMGTAKLCKIASAMKFEKADAFNADKRFCDLLVKELENYFNALTDEEKEIISDTYYYALQFYKSVI